MISIFLNLINALKSDLFLPSQLGYIDDKQTVNYI